MLLTGCAGQKGQYAEGSGDPDPVSESLQKKAPKDADAPKESALNREREQVSHIGTDPAGYATEDIKEAFFWGEGLSDTFWIVEAESGHRVYKGSLQPYENCSVSENSLWIGTFSDLTGEGEYYIETPVIGQSELFSIKQDPIFSRAKLAGLWKQQMKQQPDANSLLLMGMTAELYPEENETLVQSLTDYALSMARDVAGPGDEPAALAERICMLCQIASLSEAETSEELAKSARDGFDILKAMPDGLPDRERAVATASAALFKLTGDGGYAEEAEAFLTGHGTITGETFPILWFYLTAGPEVDTDLCDRMIRKLIMRCSTIAERMEQEAFPYSVTDEDLADRLFEVRLLSLADYILVSREYETAKNQRLHRLSISGMDPEQVRDPLLLADLYLAGF